MTEHSIEPDADLVAALRRAMGRPSLLTAITQKAYDFEDGHLQRLVRLKPGERAAPGDLWDYSQDLRYAEIQTPLLAYLIPFCLRAWRDDLRGTHAEYGAFVEHFYPALADRHVFGAHLTATQVAAVSNFMRQSILEEIDDQRGLTYQGMNARPYRWIHGLTTYGVLRPDVELLWTAWWSLDTIGRAVGAIQYISALMYQDEENPIFAPWMKVGGGGPPCLWEFEGNLYEHRWLEPNIEFLSRTLTVSNVRDVLKRATERLVNEPEHAIARRVYEASETRSETLEARCAELPRLLATTQVPGALLAWSVTAGG